MFHIEVGHEASHALLIPDKAEKRTRRKGRQEKIQSASPPLYYYQGNHYFAFLYEIDFCNSVNLLLKKFVNAVRLLEMRI